MTGGGHVAEPPIGGSVWFLASQGTFTFTLGLVASPPHIFFRMGGGKGRTSRHKHGTQHKTSTLGRHKKKALSPLGASSLELAPAQAPLPAFSPSGGALGLVPLGCLLLRLPLLS